MLTITNINYKILQTTLSSLEFGINQSLPNEIFIEPT